MSNYQTHDDPAPLPPNSDKETGLEEIIFRLPQDQIIMICAAIIRSGSVTAEAAINEIEYDIKEAEKIFDECNQAYQGTEPD